MTAAVVSPSSARSRWWTLTGLLCLVCAVIVIGAAGLPDRAALTGVQAEDGVVYAAAPGALAPLFTLPTADGGTVSLATLRGRPAVINFWATWCAPCTVEMPELQRAHEVFAGGVTVVGVNTGEDRATVQAWASERGLTLPLALDIDKQTAADYQLRGQPTTYLLDADGRIVDILYGPTTFDDLSRRLGPLLNLPT